MTPRLPLPSLHRSSAPGGSTDRSASRGGPRAVRLGVLLVSVVLVAACTEPLGDVGGGGGAAPAATTERTITVYGQGRSAAVASVADIAVDIEATRERLDDAYRVCGNIAGKITTAMTTHNDVAPADVRLVGHELLPGVPIETDAGETVEGATMRQRMAITVRDMTRFSRVVQGILNQGEVEVTDVRFGVANSRPLEARAREDAVVDARERARLMAHELGMRLGSLRRVRELAPAEVAGLGDVRTGLMRTIDDTAVESQYEVRSTVEVVFDLDPF